MQLSIPYRQHALPPRFGTPTANFNYCEEDFIISAWVAEFVNTVTNLAYLLYAFRGLRRLKTGNATFAEKAHYYGLALVGICSSVFHALLKYHAQIADDTSMLVATACVLHRAMTFDKSPSYTQNFTAVMVGLLGVALSYHALADEEVVHQLCFLLLLLLVSFKTRSLIRARITSNNEKQTSTRTIAFGACIFVAGYVLWQLDGIYCSELTTLKRSIGMPWSFVLEFHGWWHIMTAIGAYTFMAMVEDLTRENRSLSSEAS